jgi:hypothetical protein
MKSGPVNAVREVGFEGLPDWAAGRFGNFFPAGLGWYRMVAQTALPAEHHARFVLAGEPQFAIFPMCVGPGGAGSLTSPYTCEWAPCLVEGLDGTGLREAGRALAAWCRPYGCVRLDALNLEEPHWPPLLEGVRAARMMALPFAHFGNWHIDVSGQDFAAYLAARPGALRATLQRRGARLRQAGAVPRMVTGGTELEAAIDAYHDVYARSWKPPEPFPAFTAALIRACAAEGILRLALLERGGRTLAAQLWVMQGGVATVLKLAYDQAEKAASPGTVLTGFAIEHVLQHDGVTRLDFGRGDDPYKRDWTGSRRQRSGLLLANPLLPKGFLAIARHLAGRTFSRKEGLLF